MPIGQGGTTPTANGLAKMRAATTALNHLDQTGHKDLHQKIVSDLINAGFSYTATVKADVAQMRRIDPHNAAIVDNAFRDPEALFAIAYDLFGQIAGNVSPGITKGAAVTGQVGVGVAAATAQALASNPIAGLFQGSIWLRVAEVALGLLLVAVGVAKLTNAIPAATKLAGAVSKMPI